MPTKRPLLRLLLPAMALTLTLPCSAAVGAAPPDPVRTDWILAKLARPAPMRTGFVELRGSKLLKTPLRIEGEYQRPRGNVLVRQVRAPYSETTTIDRGEVTIARAGKAPRKFALSRAPELVGLQASFGALLAGDQALLEQHYRVASAGTRQQWTMTLTPRNAQLAAKVRDITMYGRGAELRCIETRPAASGDKPAAEVQRTLMAGAARAATGVSDGAALAALCHHDRTR